MSYKISGRFYDATFNSSIENVFVYCEYVNGSERKDLASMTTGKDGQYSFNVDNWRSKNIQITYAKSQYLLNESIVIISDDHERVINFAMDAEAYLKVHVKDTGSANPDDFVEIKKDDFIPWYGNFGGKLGFDTLVCCASIHGNKDIAYDYSIYHWNSGKKEYTLHSSIPIKVPGFFDQTIDILY